MNKPKCEECNVELEIDVVEESDIDSETVICEIFGYCPECEKRYKWKNHYKFTHYEDLEEEEN